MQSDAERTLHNLHVLSVLSHNDKLMTNEDAFDIYAPSSLRALFRTWYGERRTCNVQRVRHTIRSAIAFASKSLEDANALVGISSEHEHMRFRTDTLVMEHVRMCDGIERAKLGLRNLVQTYRDDSALVSQVQLLVSDIDTFSAVMEPHTRALLLRHFVAEGPRNHTLPHRSSSSSSSATDVPSSSCSTPTFGPRTLPLHPPPPSSFPSSVLLPPPLPPPPLPPPPR